MYMKAKEIKKIQFGGWSKRDYKEIREKIKQRDDKEFINLLVSQSSNLLGSKTIEVKQWQKNK
jgi:hypothetical protein